MTDAAAVAAAMQDVIRAHTEALHPGRGCVENERGECADRFGDQLWAVYTSWRAYGVLAAAEMCETHPDWPTARHQALRLCCLAGVRYVTVQGPGDVVVGEYDRYTNRWREYPRPFGICGSEREPDGELCTTELYARPGDVQVKCPGCGGWHGVLSRPDPR